MKDKLDAARFKISTVTPEVPPRELDRIISQLARRCTSEDLADLITEAMDAEQQVRKELAHSEARLSVLLKARTQRQIDTHQERGQ